MCTYINTNGSETNPYKMMTQWIAVLPSAFLFHTLKRTRISGQWEDVNAFLFHLKIKTHNIQKKTSTIELQ